VVVVLAGGTGGAKLARGMLDVVGAAELVVIANTADDVEVHGVHVSPDPDLVTYWLADMIDDRGWGIAGDTWKVMDALEAAGRTVWFRLGDRDLAMCLVRTEQLRAGRRLTDAHGEVVRGLGVEARVLPMSDEPVRTWVRSGGDWRPFQEFMILERGAEPEAIELRGVDDAKATPEVLDAIARADAIVIGPSNPVISIGPILAVRGIREALRDAAAPVVAVSPFVGGEVVKGPTDAFLRMEGLGTGSAAVEKAYEGVARGLVADEPAPKLPALVTDVLMDTPAARARVAEAVIQHADALRG
jgi:LPPG:FO 2-phospho-L-lactate transferase